MSVPPGASVPGGKNRGSMTDKEIQKSIRALAKDECANYQRGMCLLTDQRCHVINPNYPTIHDGAVDCDYFLECVLPADWDLNDLVSYAIWADEDEPEKLPDGMKLCEHCGKPFTPTHSKQKYCKSCGETVNREKSRERMRQRRTES